MEICISLSVGQSYNNLNRSDDALVDSDGEDANSIYSLSNFENSARDGDNMSLASID